MILYVICCMLPVVSYVVSYHSYSLPYLSAHYTTPVLLNTNNEKTPNLRASYYAEEGNSVPSVSVPVSVSIGINHPVGINQCMKGCLEASNTNEYCLCQCTPNCPSSNTQRRTGQGHEETGEPKSANSETQRQPERGCVMDCVSTHQTETGIDECIHQCPSALSII